MGRSTRKTTAKMVETDEIDALGVVKDGDVLDLGPGNHFVRFPDGVVVTTRHEYVVTAVPGEYAVLNKDVQVIKTFTVEKAKKDDPNTD